ncbi:5637_t:CDS:2, partial [Racocetra persica]
PEQSTLSSQASELDPGYIYLTQLYSTNKELVSKIVLLKKKVKILKEKLETFKKPGTSSLKFLQQLKEAEKETKRVANKKQYKNEMATQKQIAHEAKKIQKQEAQKQKKKKIEHMKAEKQYKQLEK